MARNRKVSKPTGGVRQGSILTPMLFNMITNETVRRVREGQDSEYQKLWYTEKKVIWEREERK
jgi:hypothetical protein